MTQGSGCFLTFSFIPITSDWTNPDARLPSFSNTYLVGEMILLAWQPLNKSMSDLWLMRYNTSVDTFALRIASTLDISAAGSFPWTIALAEEDVFEDTRFELSFVPEGANYDAKALSNIVSPGFNLMMVNQATPPNGTAVSNTSVPLSIATSGTSTEASTTATAIVASPLNSSSNDNSGVSTATIGGIAVGVIVAVGLAGFAIGYFVFKKRQSRHNQKETIGNPEVTLAGPYEILGDRRHPVEVNGKERQVHEINCSQDTIVSKSDRALVHEVGNTVKRPGLHEMPG